MVPLVKALTKHAKVARKDLSFKSWHQHSKHDDVQSLYKPCNWYVFKKVFGHEQNCGHARL